MKAIFISLLLIVLTCCAHQKSIVTKEISYNENDFVEALKSDNNGLVESSIFQIVYHHLYGLDMMSPRILAELESLKLKGKTEKMKRNSGIAIEFFNEFDSSLRTEVKYNFFNRGNLFEVIDEVLKKKKKDEDENNYLTIE